jgi:hypothetical protein
MTPLDTARTSRGFGQHIIGWDKAHQPDRWVPCLAPSADDVIAAMQAIIADYAAKIAAIQRRGGTA